MRDTTETVNIALSQPSFNTELRQHTGEWTDQDAGGRFGTHVVNPLDSSCFNCSEPANPRTHARANVSKRSS